MLPSSLVGSPNGNLVESRNVAASNPLTKTLCIRAYPIRRWPEVLVNRRSVGLMVLGIEYTTAAVA